MRNNNSSRFGKFIELRFQTKGGVEMCRGRVIGDGDPGSESSEGTERSRFIFVQSILEKMKRVRMIAMIVMITQNHMNHGKLV